MSRTIIPFGPQHPVLPEPIHLTLVTEDDIVVEAIPRLGFVHRGLEKLVEIRDYQQMIQICERVCGICSTIHAQCYCQCIEKMLHLQIPDRARYLRVFWAEVHRLQSHLLWLGLFADAMGFESLFMQCWKVRELTMDINESTGGNRVNPSINVIGGTRLDLDAAMIRWCDEQLQAVGRGTEQVQNALLTDYTVKKRTVGVGTLSGAKAYELGAVGPTLRGSGIAQDIRMDGYAAYGDLGFTPVVEDEGDCYARMKVRFRETLQSVELARKALAMLPGGEFRAETKEKPSGEEIMRVEQPRGELLYYIKANGTKNLERLRIRTPTFANIPPLLAMIPGCETADVPVIVLSIDPCISCTER